MLAPHPLQLGLLFFQELGEQRSGLVEVPRRQVYIGQVAHGEQRLEVVGAELGLLSLELFVEQRQRFVDCPADRYAKRDRSWR